VEIETFSVCSHSILSKSFSPLAAKGRSGKHYERFEAGDALVSKNWRKPFRRAEGPAFMYLQNRAGITPARSRTAVCWVCTRRGSCRDRGRNECISEYAWERRAKIMRGTEVAYVAAAEPQVRWIPLPAFPCSRRALLDHRGRLAHGQGGATSDSITTESVQPARRSESWLGWRPICLNWKCSECGNGRSRRGGCWVAQIPDVAASVALITGELAATDRVCVSALRRGRVAKDPESWPRLGCADRPIDTTGQNPVTFIGLRQGHGA